MVGVAVVSTRRVILVITIVIMTVVTGHGVFQTTSPR
jgi:hypothetical protein